MLTIKDLSTSKELDHAALTTVRGGKGMPGSDFLNSFNLFHIDNKLDYRPDYSTDVLNQFQFGNINASNNFGSVVIPQLAQNQEGANGSGQNRELIGA